MFRICIDEVELLPTAVRVFVVVTVVSVKLAGKTRFFFGGSAPPASMASTSMTSSNRLEADACGRFCVTFIAVKSISGTASKTGFKPLCAAACAAMIAANRFALSASDALGFCDPDIDLGCAFWENVICVSVDVDELSESAKERLRDPRPDFKLDDELAVRVNDDMVVRGQEGFSGDGGGTKTLLQGERRRRRSTGRTRR